MQWKFESPWFDGELETVVNGFDQALFKALNPPWMPMQVQRFDGCAPGDVVELRMGLPPLALGWTSEITDAGKNANSWWFVDEGKRLPFFLKRWKHQHVVECHEGRCRVLDLVDFDVSHPLWGIMLPLMRQQFAYRKKAYPRYFSK